MRFTTRTLTLVATALAVGYGSVASASLFEVAGSPPAPSTSDVSLNIDLGEVGGTVATLGPLAVSGSANADVSVSADGASSWQPGAGNGTLTFNGTSLLIQNTSQTVSLGAFLGSVDVTLTGVGMSITSDAIPVVGNEWNIDSIGAPSLLDVSLNQGTILLDNATGVLGSFIPAEGINFDLSADPLTVTLADLLGTGFGGTADSNSIGINIPQVAALITDDPIAIFGVLSGSVYLGLVPEPGSYVMLGMGLVGLAFARRRLRRS